MTTGTATAPSEAELPEAGPGGIWARLGRRLVPLDERPRLAGGVEVARFPHDERWGSGYATLRSPSGRVFLRLGTAEADLAEALDGVSTVGQVADVLGVDPSEAVEVVEELRSGGFLDESSVDIAALLQDRLHPESRRARFLRTLELEWGGADRLVQWAYRRFLHRLFNPVVAVLAALLSLSGLVAFAALVRPGAYHLRPARPGWEFVTIIGLNVVLIFCHEFGHAAVIAHYGRRIKAGGFRIYFGAPAFFVDAADALMLARRQRMFQAAAGVIVELVLAAPATLFVWAHPEGAASQTLYKWAVLNYFVVFLNAAPMLELDGYLFFSDLVRIPDLRRRSHAALRRVARGRVAGLDRRERIAAGYGLLDIAFTVFSVWLTVFFWRRLFLNVIRSMWHAGPVGVGLLVVLVIFLAGPALRRLAGAARGMAEAVAWVGHVVWFRIGRRWRVAAALAVDASGHFGDVAAEVLSDIAGRFERRTYRTGEVVFDVGDRPRAMYLVERGCLRLTRPTGGISDLRAGQVVGHDGILDGDDRDGRLEATRRTRLAVLDEATYRRTLAGV